jgi:putative ABC transport system permease protein
VRIALGATQRQIIRLGLSESVLLAGVAAMLGAILAWWGVDALASLLPVSDGRRAAITLDASALAFALATACFCALVAGLPSALAAWRGSVTELLRSGGRTSVGSQARHRTLRALVVAQVAIAFVLADGAARLSSGYVKLLAANQSLASEHVLSAALNLQGRRYEEKSARVALWEQAAERVAGLPGVAAVGLISKLPLDGQADLSVLINDEVYEVSVQRTITEVSSITPGYFAAAGIPLLRGRTLQPADAHEGSLGVVVNRAFADACWPNQDPMGKVIRSNSGSPGFTARVVGLVENVRQWGADTEPRPEIYWSPQQAWGQTAYLIVRSPLPAAQLAPLLRGEVAQIDPDLPLSQVRTLQNVVHDATKGQRMLAGLINFFMGTALGLIAVGLYGTLSYNVLQRTREIGVRMAMGARRRSIVALVLRQGLNWVLTGLGFGLIASLALTFALRSLVFGLETIDALTLAIAISVVAVTTGLACCIPAWRSGRMNPLEALRAE